MVPWAHASNMFRKFMWNQTFGSPAIIFTLTEFTRALVQTLSPWAGGSAFYSSSLCPPTYQCGLPHWQGTNKTKHHLAPPFCLQPHDAISGSFLLPYVGALVPKLSYKFPRTPRPDAKTVLWCQEGLTKLSRNYGLKNIFSKCVRRPQRTKHETHVSLLSHILLHQAFWSGQD